jgi:signal transduction histidine kinase
VTRHLDRILSHDSSIFVPKYETLIKYTLVPSIPLCIIAIISLDSNTWVASEIHHFYIELIAVIFAAILAFYYMSRAHTLNDKFSLFIGIGFLVNAAIDFLHVIISFSFADQPIFLKFFIPQTWFAGRIFLSAMLAIAIAGYPILANPDFPDSNSSGQQQQKGKDRSKKLPKLLVISLIVLAIVSVLLALSSFVIIFPGVVIDNPPIHRPYEIPSFILFLIALVYFYKRGLYKKKDIFYKGILLALLIDIFGQIIMAFSVTSFDTAHNVGHVLKDVAYFVNIIALALSSIQYNAILSERNAVIQTQFQKLKESEKMKDEFINVAAHELRTPIQPILGLTEIIHSETTDPRQLDYLDVVIRNARRLKQLTDNVLDVTKIESKSLKLNKEPINLNIVIAEVLKEYTNKIQYRNMRGERNRQYPGQVKISYELKQKDDDIIVEADKNRLAQVMSNLISNALKFTEKESEARISIVVEKNNPGVERNQGIVVSVKDSGEGINPVIFPNMFSKFVSSSYSGTGLGLYISKSIIDAHGGTIWAENNKNGKGATFYFTLPLSTDKQLNYKLQENEQEIKRITR